MPEGAAPVIRLLPEALVNRIAAGEVIERPAAAVKELVENALDAGATRIAVRIVDGGIGRIEVTDDGCGMSAEALPLALRRHATSKLADETLVRIATLGFRGEALPSIGAAARLSLLSRTRDAAHASRIRVEGGHVTGPEPAAGPPGTSAVVTDLFWATPARRKFLKAPRTEAEQAEAAVRRLALAAPGIAFLFETDGRVAFDLPAQDAAARVAALLGQEAAAALLPVEAERGPLLMHGFACAPGLTRATATAQSFAVNGRPVLDPVLRTALRVAYQGLVPAGRHAVAALSLTLPAEELDVNVHPAKTELRFRDAEAVKALVIGGVRRALSGGAGRAHVALQSRPGRPGVRLQAAAPASAPPTGFAELPLPLGLPPAARPPVAAQPDPAHVLGAAVAQVLDTYIIAVASDGALVLVDQHAAAERLAHEALATQHLAGGVRAQPLLLPGVVDLPVADAGRLVAQADFLASLGVELEAFGPGAVLVRALPAVLGAPEPGSLLRDIADTLAECGEATPLELRLDAAIARMACHGSLRAGRRLGQAEMDGLLRRMEATPRAATCSHGRPTFLRLSRAEIERMFGRR